MIWLRFLSALAFLTIGIQAFATSNIPPEVSSPWQTTSFVAKLPPPFHSITVVLQSDDGVPQRIAIKVNGKSLKIDEELLEGLSDMRVDSIVHTDPDSIDSGLLEFFEILVLFGEFHKVGKKPCDELRDYTHEQDFVVFRVDSALTVSRKIWPAQILDRCGP